MRVYVLQFWQAFNDGPEPPVGVYATLEAAQAMATDLLLGGWKPHQEMAPVGWRDVPGSWGAHAPDGWWLVSACEVRDG